MPEASSYQPDPRQLELFSPFDELQISFPTFSGKRCLAYCGDGICDCGADAFLNSYIEPYTRD